MWYLAGDVGGTNTRLLAVEQAGTKTLQRCEAEYDSQASENFTTILQQFIADYALPSIDCACFAVAGPVQGESAKITNLPWHIHVAELKELFKTDSVLLINDFSGVAHGISQLKDRDLLTLQAAAPQAQGPRLVLGAGTGLGMAIIERSTDVEHIIETEAGHIGFAPADTEQFELAKFWQERINRVTNETFLSGKGIARIFDFYASQPQEDISAQMLASMKHEDPATVINLYATKYREPLALKTMQCFADIYASVAGDMALACKATGGVYLTGGIAPNALPFLQSDRFVQRFNDKPPMQALMATLPVQVVLNTSVGLLGAMSRAMKL